MNQLGNETVELSEMLYSLDGVSLRLSSAYPISWGWVISFAMGMSDSMIAGNPLLYAASIFSVQQQQIIKAISTLGAMSLT